MLFILSLNKNPGKTIKRNIIYTKSILRGIKQIKPNSFYLLFKTNLDLFFIRVGHCNKIYTIHIDVNQHRSRPILM